MRYFLDTEYNGFGGALLSLALVPDDGGDEFYVTLKCSDPPDPWVERHVLPYLDMVPEPMRGPRMSRREAAETLAGWLATDRAPEIVADWPEDLAQLAMLLVIGPGRMMPMPPLTLQFQPLAGFSTAANSAVPHNALHDARALRDHVINHLE
ncbi:hypothetical protein FMM02_04715 [Sphingomonas xanthus]|uniref:Uncharacterized protein n=1 Tax=Sphingomonas xanthus TaxID=2594473 RepID=A0A516IUG7_9SPHN|nr:hypothetical protein [Sphingomonas xanthus]QDP20520.1 hypothetical protein FMM02_04715 [Sphingomonas xanthus]